MKILLVQVPTSHLGAKELVYPLGLSRLASLVPVGFEKSALDMNLYPDPWPELKNRLEHIRPDVVALSFRNIDPLAGHQTSYLSSFKTAAGLARRLAPHAVILAGGPAFTLFAKRLMEEIPQIDYGIVGEGERSFASFLSRLPDVGSAPGLLSRQGSEVIQGTKGTFISMDKIPDLDTESFSPKDYLTGNNYVAAMGIEGKRGCDLKCAYCTYPAVGGARVRLRAPAKIVDEMEQLQMTYGVDLFHFTDPVINRPKDHFEAVCNEIMARKLKIGWTGFFREDALTDDIAECALKAGLVACYFSADALTGHGLSLLNKGMTKEDILRASAITATHNILTVCHFLVNLPFETAGHVLEAREMMERILDIHGPVGNLGAVIFNNIRLYPGAALTKRLIKRGLLDPNVDLMYPVYYNPQGSSYALHELDARCHAAGVMSRLGVE